MVERIRVNLPVGRVVQGDLYKANDTDFVTKQKRVYPAGHRLAGQPKITYFFAVAIKKGAEQAWHQTPWGQQIASFGFQAWPVDQRTGQSAAQRDDFAWKIEDGDSLKPNKAGRINARSEGMPGCWIVSCSSTYPPKILDSGFAPITEPNAVKRGFWVETVVTVDSNESAGNPGIYINGEFVMFKGIDKEIGGQAVDPRSIAGFGSSALPAHVLAAGAGAPAMAPGSPTPQFPGGPSPSFPTSGGAPGGFAGAPGAMPPLAPALPSMGAPAPSMGAPAPMGVGGIASPFSPPQPGPVTLPPGVTSVPGFLPNAPAAAAGLTLGAPAMMPLPPPAAPLPPAAPAGPQLTAKVPQGVTWAQMQAQGWTIETARAQGYIA